MDMLSYLTALIKTRKEVGIPGVGTIYKKKSPGRYDAETHSFLPPTYALEFSEEVREQSSLVEYVGKKKSISQAAATYYVDQFGEELKKQLNDQQEVSLGTLGILSNASGNLTFTPGDQQNFGFEFYGLPALKEEVIQVQPDDQENDQEPEITPIEDSEPVQGIEEITTDYEEVAGEDQLNLENSNADLGDGHIEPLETEEVEEFEQVDITEFEPTPDEQPVFDEIAEVEPPEKKTTPASQPTIETPEGIEEQEESRTDQKVWIRPTINETFVQQPPADITTEDEDKAVYYHLDDENVEKAKMSVYLKILITILILLIAATAVYVMRPDLVNKLLKPQESPALVTTPPIDEQALKQTADSIAKADSIKKSVEATLIPVDSVKKDTVAITKPIKQTPVPPATESIKEGTLFELIGSSLSSQKEADRFVAQMKKIGINAKAIPGKKIRVSIATFKDDKSARAAIPKFEEKLGIKGLYVYTHKPE